MYVISVFIRSCAYFTKYKSFIISYKRFKLPQVVDHYWCLIGPGFKYNT